MPTDPNQHTDDLAAIAAQLDAVPLPPPTLPGWQSLSASEYARSVWGIRMAIDAARASVQRARATAG